MLARRTKKATRRRWIVVARGRTRTLLAISILVLGFATLGAGPSVALAQTPPVLTEEELRAVAPVDVVQVECNRTTNTLTYRAEGTASGPYPGSFVETGTATFDPVTEVLPNGTVREYGRVTSLQASFTINSEVGTVTGTKALHPTITLSIACDYAFSGTDLLAFVTYEATILTRQAIS